jgi:transcriptional regulator with XRE-family HTH domain
MRFTSYDWSGAGERERWIAAYARGLLGARGSVGSLAMGEASIARSFDVLATRLKDARRQRDWTLDKLAERTGLSKPYLARLESGQRQPSLAVLITLAQTFGLPIASLLDDGEAGDTVVVSRDRASEQHGDGLRYELLSPAHASAAMQAMHVTVPAGRSGDERYQHAGEEWLYVLRGTLGLSLGSREIELVEGDAAQFDASTPHRLTALGDDAAEVLLVAMSASA